MDQDLTGRGCGTSAVPDDVVGDSCFAEFSKTCHDLREELKFYETLVRYSAVPTFVIDARHRVIIWNRACEQLTGVAESEILGTDNHWQPFYEQRRPTLADLVVENKAADISAFYATHRASCQTMEELQAEGWYAALGGKARYIVFEAAPIHNGKGELIAAIETLRDITESKLLERQLQKSKAELQVKHEQMKHLFHVVNGVKKEWVKTMDCLADVIIVTDENGRIKQCNRALRELVNKPDNEIMGKSWSDILSIPQASEKNFCLRAMEFFYEAAERWFDLRIYSSVDANGAGIPGMLITLHDTTESRWMHSELEQAYSQLKNTHAQMLQNEKLASIGQLAAGVAHEVNNPIGFISSNLTSLGKYVERLREFIALQDRAVNSDTTDREELAGARRQMKVDHILEDIGPLIAESVDGADRVRKIVQNLKSFSRVDEAESKQANLVECLDSTINIVWNELKYKATLQRDFSEIPLTVCHPQQLNQVFMNLLVNSAQAIEVQGEIIVSCWHENGSIYVSVSDTGSGIPEEIRHRLFEPFFTTKEVGMGTGLGLSISYDIIKKHNGEITVQSEVGKGTTFTVQIPVVERR